jgi:hypothetical protein
MIKIKTDNELSCDWRTDLPSAGRVSQQDVIDTGDVQD